MLKGIVDVAAIFGGNGTHPPSIANVRFWLGTDIPGGTPELPLLPQQRTFNMAMSALAPITSALPPTADVLRQVAKRPLLTQNGHRRKLGNRHFGKTVLCKSSSRGSPSSSLAKECNSRGGGTVLAFP